MEEHVYLEENNKKEFYEKMPKGFSTEPDFVGFTPAEASYSDKRYFTLDSESRVHEPTANWADWKQLVWGKIS